MPPASLTTFPAELLIQVYKSLDNVKDVTALNLASHQFYNLWLSHTVSISDAVFSRAIKSFDDARELAEIQQKFVERNHCDDNGHHDRYQEALERNKLLTSNEDAFRTFYQQEKPWLNSDENLMSKIYYCVCMLILMKDDAFAQSSCLASLDLETLQHMFNVMNRFWLVLSFVLEDDDGLGLRVLPEIDLKKLGRKSRMDMLENARDTLEQRISALKMAGEVGNDMEDV